MKRKISLLVSFIFLLSNTHFFSSIAFSFSFPEHVASFKLEVDARDRELWRATVEKYLLDELWTKDNIYDAGHRLIAPMHFAFYFNEKEWQKQFYDHYVRFIDAYQMGKVDSGRLNMLHYLYSVSQFLVLSRNSESAMPQLPFLADIVYKELQGIWNQKPAWQWAMPHFEGGIRERLKWKLSETKLKKKYYGAIIDEELFVFAIAADLSIYGVKTQVIQDIKEFSLTVFEKYGYYTKDGGWLFQPGAMSDHPDYIYAGNEKVVPGLTPKIVEHLARDTSHSHRFPLFLKSLENAEEKTEKRTFYSKISEAFARQFIDNVLVPPSDDSISFRVKNFMDGKNGVYRYKYQTLGTDKGYGPYELSGTLLGGWWGFLKSEEIFFCYRYLAELFPLPSSLISDLYMQQNTSRTRHFLVAIPNYFQNGFAELNARMMCKICALYLRNL
jgi:hypothetical protein